MSEFLDLAGLTHFKAKLDSVLGDESTLHTTSKVVVDAMNELKTAIDKNTADITAAAAAGTKIGDSPTNPNAIGDAYDLNSLTNSGWYAQLSSTHAHSGTNYPPGNPRGLMLTGRIGSNTTVTQTYFALDGTIYTRAINGVVWFGWSKLGFHLNNNDLPTTASDLGTGKDLNTVKIPGFYKQTTNAHATTALHYPTASAGLLEVFHTTTNGLIQRYTTYSNPIPYIRETGDGKTWGAWDHYYTSAHRPSLADLGLHISTSKPSSMTSGHIYFVTG